MSLRELVFEDINIVFWDMLPAGVVIKDIIGDIPEKLLKCLVISGYIICSHISLLFMQIADLVVRSANRDARSTNRAERFAIRVVRFAIRGIRAANRTKLHGRRRT